MDDLHRSFQYLSWRVSQLEADQVLGHMVKAIQSKAVRWVVPDRFPPEKAMFVKLHEVMERAQSDTERKALANLQQVVQDAGFQDLSDLEFHFRMLPFTPAIHLPTGLDEKDMLDAMESTDGMSVGWQNTVRSMVEVLKRLHAQIPDPGLLDVPHP